MSKTLASIKERILSCKGRRVRCLMAKGRNRFEESEGVITDVYPKLFTLYDVASQSTISFSYAEVLTGEIELKLIDDAGA